MLVVFCAVAPAQKKPPAAEAAGGPALNRVRWHDQHECSVAQTAPDDIRDTDDQGNAEANPEQDLGDGRRPGGQTTAPEDGGDDPNDHEDECPCQ